MKKTELKKEFQTKFYVEKRLGLLGKPAFNAKGFKSYGDAESFIKENAVEGEFYEIKKLTNRLV